MIRDRNGINTPMAPIWQTETAPPQWRGKLVLVEMVMNIFGSALVNWINYGLSFCGGAVAWQFPIAFQFVFIIILFSTVPWLPESPRWLLSHDHATKAVEVLACLEEKPVNDPFISLLRQEIEYSIHYELILGAGVQLIQQFEGINVMSYYMPTVFMNSFVSFLIITILLRLAEDEPTGLAVASTSIAFFFLFYAFFGLGMLSIPWLYPAEISSLPMQTKSAPVATATNWICNFIIVEITPIGIQNIGWKFWIIWMVLTATFLLVIYLFYPETANRSLEDIDAYYRSNPSLFVIRDPDANCTKRPQKYIQHESEEVQKNAKQGTLKMYKTQSHMVENVE
ncbi:hypothetical protein SI65_03808 [Aspergillus cristatus]|uniref:Major facilitator superfamily (MFS) profile domain-containing protein n=1 Tax=Aspergillus cristatus TaxID=573508 RepID=A0A1E3BIG8_ASPCR|nr:hypothetical protein SI65_03808 [Aspergillus cristatus]